ncbi:MAG TPA: hypothetical protein VHP14_08710 [Anaerolineales bacterium]|nr:hypothetical protein [Anaerolineales bacterium]
MTIGFLQLLNVTLSSIPPLDAVPPGTIAVLGFGVLLALGCGVALIVAVSVVVIRAIKKKNTSGDKN